MYHVFALSSFRHNYNKENGPNWKDSVASSARYGANKDGDTKSLGIARPLGEHLQASSLEYLDMFEKGRGLDFSLNPAAFQNQD